VDRWERKEIGGGMTEPAPTIRVDAVRWWTPTPDKNVDFAEVRDYIVSLRQRGFNIRLVTFDRWRSDDMIEFLNGIGIRAEVLSVDIKHYTDLAMVVQERRIAAPQIPLLQKELLRLRIMPNGKIDHPRDGSKDLADATCGAVFNAISHTPRTHFDTIEIVTAQSLREEELRQKEKEDLVSPEFDRDIPKFDGTIRPPKNSQREMPPELSNWIDNLRLI
jgi:phage terminase large subunit-like protein